jgi:hypothetical protein
MHKKRKVELIQFHLEEAHKLIHELNEENTTKLHLCVSEGLQCHTECYRSFESLIADIHQRYVESPEYQGGNGD